MIDYSYAGFRKWAEALNGDALRKYADAWAEDRESLHLLAEALWEALESDNQSDLWEWLRSFRRTKLAQDVRVRLQK